MPGTDMKISSLRPTGRTGDEEDLPIDIGME
jgi:hypothetical protein